MIKIKVGIDLAARFNEEVKRQRSIITDNLVKSLKEATPVDTGHARDSWVATGNSIINTADYIDRLNAGSSKQAPAFFVEKTLLAQEGVSPSGTIVRSL